MTTIRATPTNRFPWVLLVVIGFAVFASATPTLKPQTMKHYEITESSPLNHEHWLKPTTSTPLGVMMRRQSESSPPGYDDPPLIPPLSEFVARQEDDILYGTTEDGSENIVGNIERDVNGAVGIEAWEQFLDRLTADAGHIDTIEPFGILMHNYGGITLSIRNGFNYAIAITRGVAAAHARVIGNADNDGSVLGGTLEISQQYIILQINFDGLPVYDPQPPQNPPPSYDNSTGPLWSPPENEWRPFWYPGSFAGPSNGGPSLPPPHDELWVQPQNERRITQSTRGRTAEAHNQSRPRRRTCKIKGSAGRYSDRYYNTRRDDSLVYRVMGEWHGVEVIKIAASLNIDTDGLEDYITVLDPAPALYWANESTHCPSSDHSRARRIMAGIAYNTHTPSAEQEEEFIRCKSSSKNKESSSKNEEPNIKNEEKRDYVDDGRGGTHIETNCDHAISKGNIESMIRHFSERPFERLPNDFNSVQVPGGFLSWSIHGGDRKNNDKFEGGATPSSEEIIPYLERFTGTEFSLLGCFFSRKRSAIYRNVIFGNINQAVCISNRGGGCKN